MERSNVHKIRESKGLESYDVDGMKRALDSSG